MGTVEDKVRSMGFDSVISFSMSCPTLTRRQFADAVAADLAPVAVLGALREECFEEDAGAYFAASMLVRLMHEFLPKGMGNGSDFDHARCFGTWSANVACTCDGVLLQIWERLRGAQLGWLPEDTNDVFLRTAMEEVTIKLQ